MYADTHMMHDIDTYMLAHPVYPWPSTHASLLSHTHQSAAPCTSFPPVAARAFSLQTDRPKMWTCPVGMYSCMYICTYVRTHNLHSPQTPPTAHSHHHPHKQAHTTSHPHWHPHPHTLSHTQAEAKSVWWPDDLLTNPAYKDTMPISGTHRQQLVEC